MTAIAALIDGESVWMGGDAAGVGGYSLELRSDPKVFVSGEFLIGYTSSFRMGQLLQYSMTPPKPVEGQDAMAYMVTTFVPEVRRVLKDNGYLRVDSNQELIGEFLIGWRGQLYGVQDDLQVARLLTPYAACGCGRDLALGSLHTTNGYDIVPRERLTLALKAAEAFSAGVRGPFTVLKK